MGLSNKQKAVAVIEAIGTDNADALAFICPDAFVQHDGELADGREGYEAWFQDRPVSAKIEVVRLFEDGDYVFAHSFYDLGEPRAGADVFRFEDGLIVEHWNNFQKMEGPNPSGRTLLDGATELGDLDRTENNKALVRDFLKTHLVNGSDDVARFFDGDTYIQHNSGIADGVSGLLAAGKAYKEKGVEARFKGIHRILGEGNFVLAMSEGSVGDADIAFFDFYRLEDGKLTEHWDILETITPESERKNGNGKF